MANKVTCLCSVCGSELSVISAAMVQDSGKMKITVSVAPCPRCTAPINAKASVEITAEAESKPTKRKYYKPVVEPFKSE